MGKTFVPAAVLAVTLAAMLATLVALATPAYPQVVSEDLAADEDGNLVRPRPPDYEVDENGLLIIGGDVLIPCSDIGMPSELPRLGGEDPGTRAKIEQTRREEIRACQAAGFDTAGNLPASASPSPSAPADAAALPETGGPALLAPLLLATVATLAAGSLLVLGARWRLSLGACPRVDDSPLTVPALEVATLRRVRPTRRRRSRRGW